MSFNTEIKKRTIDKLEGHQVKVGGKDLTSCFCCIDNEEESIIFVSTSKCDLF